MNQNDLASLPVEPGLPSRRTVVAGALWATPVVMGLSAAPAFASSSDGTNAHLDLNTHAVWATWTGGSKTGAHYLITLQNLELPAHPTVTLIKTSVFLPADRFGSASPSIVPTSDGVGQWTYLERKSAPNDTVEFVFQWTGALLSGLGQTRTLEFEISAASAFSAVQTKIEASSPQQDPTVAINGSPLPLTVS